jgi:CheY-like chemotaxis protein
MEGISTLINSIATIMWPLIVIVILIIFRKSVRALIDSARGRKFQVKIGDMELSMDELSQQQSIMIKDLQTRVNMLQRKLDAQATVPVETAKEEPVKPMREPVEEKDTPKVESYVYENLDLDDDISSILWVDDKPTNNALLIDALQNLGITVSTAKDTQSALNHFRHGSFDCVISDSCRREGSQLDNCQAGIELASLIRELDEEVPVYIYTDKVDATLKQKAEDAGATAVTSSPSELLKLLSD